jgi:ABC-type multidrug transport system permease subunit
MLRALLLKDLLRARRNPLLYVIFISMPLLITALIGITFGGSGEERALGKIRIGVVDEDDSLVGRFLRGGLNQQQAGGFLEPVLLSRSNALTEIANNRLSAVVIVPEGFSRGYLTGIGQVALELIKNPAQSFHPAIVEELVSAVVTALNALARPLESELPSWQAAFEAPGGPDLVVMGDLIKRAGEGLESAREYVFPPLITYGEEGRGKPLAAGKATSGGVWNVFAFLLPGLSAMFMLFLADQTVRDLYREVRFRTFQRFSTLRQGLFGYVFAKVLFALLILAIAGSIMLGGGAWIFGFSWKHPLALVALFGGFALFATGLMALLASLAGSERRADVLNTMISMALGLAGGCAFPPDGLPDFIRHGVMPFLPTYWVVDAARRLEFQSPPVAWPVVTVELLIVGVALVAGAAVIFRGRLERGLTA